MFLKEAAKTVNIGLEVATSSGKTEVYVCEGG